MINKFAEIYFLEWNRVALMLAFASLSFFLQFNNKEQKRDSVEQKRKKNKKLNLKIHSDTFLFNANTESFSTFQKK